MESWIPGLFLSRKRKDKVDDTAGRHKKGRIGLRELAYYFGFK
jgi:hypothetical protein